MPVLLGPLLVIILSVRPELELLLWPTRQAIRKAVAITGADRLLWSDPERVGLGNTWCLRAQASLQVDAAALIRVCGSMVKGRRIVMQIMGFYVGVLSLWF